MNDVSVFWIEGISHPDKANLENSSGEYRHPNVRTIYLV